jgi:inner membrane protein
VRGDAAVDDAEHPAHDIGAAGEQEAQRIRDAQHPLAHRLLGKNLVDQQCSTLGHTPGAAAGTETPAFATESDSKAEMVLMTWLLAVCLLLYPVSGLGFRVGLQQLLGNFDMAHDAFLKNAGSYWYTLKLEAVDNLTLEKISCDCPVVGAWKQGLIVIHDGQARAVGKSQLNHNLYPIHAELIRGEPLRVVSQRVNLRGRSLRWLTDSLDQAHTYYINGQVVVGRRTEPIEDLDLYRPATLTGKVLRLHYAKA